MNEIQNIETKVENGGTTPQGRVSAAEFNIITDAAKRFDVSKYGAARISEGGQLQFFADAASMASYEADPQTNAALLLKSLSLPTSDIDISGKLDKAEFYRYFEEVNIGTAAEPKYAIHAKYGLYTDSFLSALGLNPNTGGGGGGGATALSELSDVQLSGLLTGDVLIYDGTHWVNRPQSSIAPDLSEYATRTWVQQQGYATSAALTAHAGNTSLHVTSSERTLWNRTAADFAAIVGADSDQIINKWEEVVAFLDTYTEADTLANLLSNKVDKVTGYGLSKNDFTDALLSKLNGIDAGANRYIHPTGGADVAIDDAAGRVLAGITVNALGHVTSVASKTLAAADIPTLSISKVSGLQDALDGKLDKAEFYKYFEEVNIGTAEAPVYATRSKRGLFSDSFLSSLGLNSSGGGGTGGGSYDRLDLWSDYTSERAGWVLSAGLGYDLYNRVRSLEGGSALSFTTEGSGNVVTAVKKSGTAVVVTKGLTALTSHQPIYALNFQAGAFEAKKYTPNTGVATVNIPTKTSHLSNDSGFITSAALTGYATQSWVQGLGYITASALTPYITSATANATFATKLGVSGTQIGTYVNGKLGNLITVPYATNAALLEGVEGYKYFRQQRGMIDSASLETFTMRDSGTFGIQYAGHTEGLAYFLGVGSSSSLEMRFSYEGLLYARFSADSNRYTTDWKQFAFTDSNVASATKLQTARTLWGQSFNGEGNVSGNMTGVGSISASGEYITSSANGFRIAYGKYGTIFREDESEFWILLTDSGNSTGTFNSLRPFHINLSTGKTYIGGSGLTATVDGYIGINNPSPSYKLDVAGQARFSKGLVVPYQWGSWLNMATRDDVIQGENKNSADSAHTLFRVKDVNGNPIAFGGLGAHVGFYGFLATEVSQGVNSPKWSTRWEVATGKLLHGGDIAVSGRLQLANKVASTDTILLSQHPNFAVTYDNHWGIYMWATGNGRGHIQAGNQDDNATMYSLVLQELGGNVGIGNPNPQYKCDVAGVVHATTGIFSDGYMSAKGINTASDVRLKRRIADVALTVRDVAEAPVYRFAWINGGGIDVGSTAQYWGAKVPELTHLLADGIHLGLDYGKAALLSVVAVARSTADHERRIASLERQLQNRTI